MMSVPSKLTVPPNSESVSTLLIVTALPSLLRSLESKVSTATVATWSTSMRTIGSSTNWRPLALGSVKLNSNNSGSLPSSFPSSTDRVSSGVTVLTENEGESSTKLTRPLLISSCVKLVTPTPPTRTLPPWASTTV